MFILSKMRFVPLGLGLILLAGLWKFGLSTPLFFSQRFPDGWRWQVNTLGLSGYPDPATGQFPEGTTLADDPLIFSVRSVSASADGQPAGLVQITDHYETRDTITNAVTWEFATEAIVDGRTGQYVDGDFAGDYYFLPRNLDRHATYSITNVSFHSLPMTFQHEELVSGISTYLFANYAPFNNTSGNADLVQLEPGQEVWCFDFSLEYWVEPISGEIVKFREWCEGDWITDAETGERIAPISRWSGETTGDDLIRNAQRVGSALNLYYWVTLYLPLLVAVIGGLLAGFGVVARRELPWRSGWKGNA